MQSIHEAPSSGLCFPTMDDDDGPRRQVYIRAASGKPLQSTVDEVLRLFEDTGKPTQVLNKWGEEPTDGKLHERVLVSFKKNKAVQRAVGLSGSWLSDREVVIGINTQPPKARGQACGSCRVFVGNLPFDADEVLLKETFAPCGRVLFVRFAMDEESGKPAGFCHIIFEDKDGKGTPAQKALSLGGTELKGRAISVAPALAKEKKKRPLQLPTQEADRAAAEEAKKGKRPADWRHDRAAGLTLPRGPKKPRVEW